MRVPRRLAVLPLGLLAACAWTARENRPVYNAFEEHLVPESGAAWWVALPLTLPVGFGAILVDTFVAHPIQVVDDAWSDTCDLWRDIDFEEQYYTESALLPVRAVGSPLWFVGSFLGRSVFDWPSHEEAERRAQAARARRRSETMRWLEAIAARRAARRYQRLEGPFDAALRAAVDAALASGDAHGRMSVYEAVARCEEPVLVDWNAALGDASAVVRYAVVELVPGDFALAAEVRAAMLADPDEAVRERAQRRWRP